MFPKVPVDEYCHFNKKKETRKKIKHKKKKEGKATKKKKNAMNVQFFETFFPYFKTLIHFFRTEMFLGNKCNEIWVACLFLHCATMQYLFIIRLFF